MLVNIINSVISLYQIARALGTYARHTGDIIGAVALDSFDFNKLGGRYAVILHYFFGGVQNIVPVGAEVNMGFVAHKL